MTAQTLKNRILAAAHRGTASDVLSGAHSHMEDARKELRDARAALEDRDFAGTLRKVGKAEKPLRKAYELMTAAADEVKGDPRYAVLLGRLARLCEEVAHAGDTAWTPRSADPED